MQGFYPILWVDKNGDEWMYGQAYVPSTPAKMAKYKVSDRTERYAAYPNQMYFSNYNVTERFRTTCIEIGGGVVLTNHYGSLRLNHLWFIQLTDGNANLADQEVEGWFTEYGWNGSAWEKDNPNSKTTHTAREALIDGLSVTFTGADANSWIDTEYYDTYVFNGVLKDNATEVTLTGTTQVLALKNTTSLNAATVPGAAAGSRTNKLAAIGKK